MPQTPQELSDIAVRHQVYLEGLKTHEVKKNQKFLKDIDKIVSKKLMNKDVSGYTKNKLNKLLASVKQDLKVISDDFSKMVSGESVDIAKNSRDFEIKTLKTVVPIEYSVPSETQLAAAVFANPLTMKGADTGKLLKPFLKDTSRKAVEQIDGIIRAGYYMGQTTPEIVRTIRGTKAALFKDGAMHRINRALNTATRTAVQHASAQARNQVWKDNEDIVESVKWVSVLDGRTSAVCRSLDGQVFNNRPPEGPRPPIHFNCRSTTVAVLDSRFDSLDKGRTRVARKYDSKGKQIKGKGAVKSIPANETYYDWLKRQPNKFQASVIGENRAKLLRDGGLSSEKFAKLQLSEDFKELTLKDMNRLEPLAFEKADVTKFID